MRFKTKVDFEWMKRNAPEGAQYYRDNLFAQYYKIMDGALHCYTSTTRSWCKLVKDVDCVNDDDFTELC